MPSLRNLWGLLLLSCFRVPATLPVALAPTTNASTQPIIGHIDLQCHMTMHIPLRPAYRPGPLGEPPSKADFKHLTKQQMYEPWMRQSGVKIFLTAAYSEEFGYTKKRARKLILSQFNYIERFVAQHSDTYGLAKTPDEVRSIVAQGKIALVHSIEGGHDLLSEPGDAKFWAEQGVVIMTLIHLRDDEFGGSARQAFLLNPRGYLREFFRNKKRRGLTEEGKAAVRALVEAGILIDITHMSPDAIEDTLQITKEMGATPISTHSKLGAFFTEDRAISDKTIQEIYQQGGMFSIPLGENLDPWPRKELPGGYCKSSVDGFILYYKHLQKLLGDSVAIGWASDFNGMANHLHPKYGRLGCEETDAIKGRALPFDTQGLAHVGLLPELWQRAEEAGVKMNQFEMAPEKLLQMWTLARQHAVPGD